MPLASTRVVHPRWAEHHAPTVEGAMGCQVQISHGGTPGTWTPQGGAVPGTPSTPWTGAAALSYADLGGRQIDAADQTMTARLVRVEIPRTAPTQVVGSRVKVTAVDAYTPAALLGARLTVQSMDISSPAATQVLLCVLDQGA